MSDLYDADILLWSEHQAALLKRLAAGDRLNERPDWANIIEEMESVGRSEFHSVESLLVQAMTHWLKARTWPDCRDEPNWVADAGVSGPTPWRGSRRRCGNGSTCRRSTVAL